MRLARISLRRCEHATRENRCADDRGGVLDDGGGGRSGTWPRASADARHDVRRAEDPDAHNQSPPDDYAGGDDDNHEPRADAARLVAEVDDNAWRVAEADHDPRLIAEVHVDHDAS